MKVTYRYPLLALLLVCALAWRAQDTYSLKREPKKGDKLVFRFEGEAEAGGMQIKLKGLTTETILKVEDNGDYVVEEKNSEGKLLFGDQEVPMPDSAVRTARNSKGEIQRISRPEGDKDGEEADAQTYRMALMTTFTPPEKPVAVDGTWAHESKADQKKGLPARKTEYKAAAVEKVQDQEAVKVEFKYKETEGDTPATSEGTHWISVKDGALLKSEAKLKNAPVPGAPAPMDLTIRMERETEKPAAK
jgi:hypothetical protein